MPAPACTMSRRSFVRLGLTAACVPLAGAPLAASAASAAPWTLSGRLIDSDGLPLRNARVSLAPSIAGRTDCDGRFFIVASGSGDGPPGAAGKIGLEVTPEGGEHSVPVWMPVERVHGAGAPLFVVRSGFAIA